MWSCILHGQKRCLLKTEKVFILGRTGVVKLFIVDRKSAASLPPQLTSSLWSSQSAPSSHCQWALMHLEPSAHWNCNELHVPPATTDFSQSEPSEPAVLASQDRQRATKFIDGHLYTPTKLVLKPFLENYLLQFCSNLVMLPKKYLPL